ncbi:hypothetical protein PACTADRAFT_3831 [Pachysolen tannophilus NRRL Y-2460]|uniref:Uncharacterized protein n=1 Tax=Pachysolen tannophilus NRRL Y-2460 TaxID=669874 RepID=A0A1E4TT97_PACTA|nr:hypothetical protein PACTADRAFT_3831 [Pachysolen tannophilus NRRL Y-2460]
MSGFRKLTSFLTAVAIILNFYIYTYPSFNSDKCSWYLPNKEEAEATLSPFQKKLIAVPYIGDLFDQYFVGTSGIDKELTLKNGKSPQDIRMLLFGDPQIKGNWPSTPYITRLDTFGNDYYLGHIYNTMKRRLKPTHISVMGDLFSSQWILDREFFNRSKRYMTRLFPRPKEHTGDLLEFITENDGCNWSEFMNWFQATLDSDSFQFGYEDVNDWTSANLIDEPLFINISGNHDIGNGDATYQHMARFIKIMGKDNFFIEYALRTDHPWRIVVLNSLAVDGPFIEQKFIDYTWSFVNKLKERPFNGSTILLTHVPFYKEEGICADAPFVEYFNESNSKIDYMFGKIKSENHLQYQSSQDILNAIFQNDKSGIILTGHDHEGCESIYNKLDNGTWVASKKIESNKYVKEIVVRSMMGEFGGNSGLMTAHFNKEAQDWEFHYTLCPFTVQHVWWVTKVTTILSILFNSICFLFNY